MRTQLPVTIETYWNLQARDKSGRAWALYCFYVQAAVRQKSSAPLATDNFCKNGLKWGSLNTVIKFRKLLLDANVIKHDHSQSYHYVQVQHMTVILPNKRFDLSEDPIPAAEMGTPLVFDHYGRYWDRLINGCCDEFAKRVKKQMRAPENFDFDMMYHHMHIVWDRLNAGTPAMLTMNSELRFWGYMLTSVAGEFDKAKMQVA